MGLFSSLISGHRRTKKEVAGLMASIVDDTIKSEGLEILFSGSIALHKNMDPIFRSGRVTVGDELLAAVAIIDLDTDDVAFLKLLALGEKHGTLPKSFDINDVTEHVEALVFAVLREFESQSRSFEMLPD